MGITRIRVERSHQFADGRPWALARTPFPVVTHAAMAEARTMATASRPRFTQPKTQDGSEIEADDRDGSRRGKSDVLHHRVHWLPAPASCQSPSYPVTLPSGFRSRQRSGSWAARSEKICFASCSYSSTVLR